MSRYKALQATMNQIQAGIADTARVSAEVTVNLRAFNLQLAALNKVMSTRGIASPKPDADGWIARPTLR